MFIDKVKILLPEINVYLTDMKNCEQDSIFHSEGHVLIHTEMVLNEVEKLNLSEKDMNILKWTATLHDIGKPYCSKNVNGHISSPGHNRIGYHISMILLDKIDMDFNDKLQILNLIREHSEPLWLMEKQNPEKEIIKLSMSCRLDLLYHISRCDVLGRIAKDDNSFLTDLEYFKELAIELDCFTKPYEFSSNIAKFNFLVKGTHHFSDNPYNDTKSKVYILSGLPGVGKDYYIKSNLNYLPVISLDEIRTRLGIKPTDEQGKVIQSAKEKAREFMRNGEDFVWNATNISKDLRKSIISLFTEYNSYITIIFIHKRLNTILEQNKNRDRVVPDSVINKLHTKMDIPTNTESHELFLIYN